ncbi:polyadenylate-binding protein RBP47B'-like [Impatiens glandulifera]|uniref:polyadenylate-binding protein RBP47B'-like n=1 Tax=Impatiens glandulifera TaxID=253017 RepID=UPI001FB1773B|nr:polyadenylate-binding protein RBP47B'-like [Impatiens glandulifera]
MEVQAQLQQQWVMSAQAQIHYNNPSVAMAAGGSSLPYHQPTTLEEVRTLWIGDLQYWVDDNYLNNCFSHTGEVISIKIIRNKMTGLPEGYGFVEFVSHAAAERVLQAYNGTQMPGTEQNFRLNWASFGIGERRPDAPDHSIFVGDLAPDVTDYTLQETFRVQYPSVRGAKVVIDTNTGRSKGYGFVKFADEAEKNRAMGEMNGVYCSTRPMRISAATPKKTIGVQQQYTAPRAVYPSAAYTPTIQTVPADNDANSTTVFIGNLDVNITEEELKQFFLQFGEIVSIQIPPTRGCGFVQFTTRMFAEEAIQKMQGATIGQQAVHLSWGKSPIAKQDATSGWGLQADPNQWSSAYYGYGQGYDPYAYGMSQDPSYANPMYSGYSHYPQQVEGSQEMAVLAGAIPAMEQKDEYDPLSTPDVNKLNASYLAVHGSTILGRPLWVRTSSMPLQS